MSFIHPFVSLLKILCLKKKNKVSCYFHKKKINQLIIINKKIIIIKYFKEIQILNYFLN